jgi:pilus assembly protein CpaE
MNALDPVTSDSKTRIRKTSVLAINCGHPDFSHLQEALEKLPNVTTKLGDSQNALSRLQEVMPDIVFVDTDAFTVEKEELIDSLRGLMPDLPIIVVSDALDDAQMRRLMKLRVHDWIRRPMATSDLINAIMSGARSSKQSSNKVHAVISANGGAGATTVAVMLADLMARSPAASRGGVGLFDLDFSTGACGDLLNIENTFSLDSVLSNPGRVDAEFVSQMQQRHPHGFAIYSFRNPELVTHLNCYELVLRMLDAVTAQHTHTILDIPYYETDWRQDVLAEVNSLTIVCELNLPSIKQTLALRNQLRSLGTRMPLVQVLINKRRRGLFGSQRIAESRIKQLFGDLPYSYLPDERDALSEAMDRGIPLSDLNRSSRFLKELARFATKRLLIEGVKP